MKNVRYSINTATNTLSSIQVLIPKIIYKLVYSNSSIGLAFLRLITVNTTKNL